MLYFHIFLLLLKIFLLCQAKLGPYKKRVLIIGIHKKMMGLMNKLRQMRPPMEGEEETEQPKFGAAIAALLHVSQ